MKTIRTVTLTLVPAFFLSSCGSGDYTTVSKYEGVYERPTVLECNSADIEILKPGSGVSYDSAIIDQLVRVKGTAFWCASQEDAERGGIHVGQIDFVAPVRDGLLRHSDTLSGGRIYQLEILFRDRVLLVKEHYPNGFVGYHGLNVSFEGEYIKE